MGRAQLAALQSGILDRRGHGRGRDWGWRRNSKRHLMNDPGSRATHRQNSLPVVAATEEQ